MAQLTPQSKSKTVPIIITILGLIVVGALGYLVYTTLFVNPDNNPQGRSLNTAALKADDLKLMQYDSAHAPTVTDAEVGRDNPFAPF